MKIDIVVVGKTREPWIQSGIEMFLTRLSGRISIEIEHVKDDSALLKFLKGRENQAIYLDPKGTEFDSVEFHHFLFQHLEHSKKVLFIVGGAEGFPPALQHCGTRLSLAKMTFTHEMALLFLMEQLYRAFEIEKKSGYHK